MSKEDKREYRKQAEEEKVTFHKIASVLVPRLLTRLFKTGQIEAYARQRS